MPEETQTSLFKDSVENVYYLNHYIFLNSVSNIIMYPMKELSPVKLEYIKLMASGMSNYVRLAEQLKWRGSTFAWLLGSFANLTPIIKKKLVTTDDLGQGLCSWWKVNVHDWEWEFDVKHFQVTILTTWNDLKSKYL